MHSYGKRIFPLSLFLSSTSVCSLVNALRSGSALKRAETQSKKRRGKVNEGNNAVPRAPSTAQGDAHFNSFPVSSSVVTWSARPALTVCAKDCRAELAALSYYRRFWQAAVRRCDCEQQDPHQRDCLAADHEQGKPAILDHRPVPHPRMPRLPLAAHGMEGW